MISLEKSVSQKIPWAKPEIDKSELNQVLDLFDKGWLSMGTKVKKFERVMADFIGAPHAVAVTNGTVALDLSLKCLGIGPGDEVIVPAMTYFATASAVSYQKAAPVFVDVEPTSFNLDPNKIEEAISPKCKAIAFIDYGGNPANIEGLKAVAQKHNLLLLQDGAHSLGGIYRNKPLGAQAPISTTSFHMAKVMTTVEGGMIFTHSEEAAEELRIRRDQGQSAKYVHSYLGTNARMTDLSAAIGLAQFEKLPWMLSERQRVAKRYDFHFKGCDKIQIMRCHQPDSTHAYFHYPVGVDSRDVVVDRLRDKGIDTRIIWPMPPYKQDLYQKKWGEAYRKMSCPVAEQFTSRVITLPIFPSLHDDQVDIIASELLKALV
jgi:dTDP-4-amino-4,6-dideoxygalactose transaminase